MTVVERANILGRLSDYLAMGGVHVEEVSDLSQVANLVEQAKKPYLTPITCPQENDFTRTNALWLVGKRQGDPVFLGCARLEDLGDEMVGRYWDRVFARAYGQGGNQPIHNHRMQVDRNFGGRLAYFGDLFVSQKSRGSHLNLRAFVALGHLAVSLKWDPDYTYCFIRERDVLRGAAARYSFTQVTPSPFEWVDPPAPRENSEWLATLPKYDVLPVARKVVSEVNLAIQGGLKNQSINDE